MSDPNAAQSGQQATPGAPAGAGQPPTQAGSPPAPGQYAPPAGAPPPGQGPPLAGAPPPGQYPGYSPYPGYPPAPAGYPQYPGYPPPPQHGAYPGYPPAPGQAPYYPPYGYPPPQGYGYPQAPPSPGPPPAPGAPGAPATGTPAAEQQSKDQPAWAGPGQPPSAVPGQPPAGYPPQPAFPSHGSPYPPPPGAPPVPFGQSPAAPGYPPPAGGFGFPAVPGGGAPVPGGVGPSGFPLWYLGAQIVDPNTPSAPLGATKVPGYNPEGDYNILMKLAISGVSDEVKVARVLLNLTLAQRDALNDFSTAKIGKNLLGYIESYCPSEGSGVLRGLVLGPLWYDVELLKKSMAGVGTDEMCLTELILNRSQEELRLLISAYKQRYGKDLVDAVKSELSGKLERLFVMALNTQRTPDSVPVDDTQVNTDVEVLVNAAKKKDEMPFIEILVNRSHPHVARVIESYSRRHKSLSKVIKKTFSGDLQKALLFILHGVKPKRDGQGIWRDAKLLEKTMAGLGTRDSTLIYRTVRAHWNPQRMEAIKKAYLNRYGKTLEHRVKGETSGPYRDVMIMVLKASEPSSK